MILLYFINSTIDAIKSYLNYLKNKYNNGIVGFISFSVVVLFCLNYPISEYLSHWDVDPDKNLNTRFNIYSIILMSCFYLSKVEHTKWSKFFLNVGLAISASDVIDRYLFDITSFQWNDIIMIILVLIFSYRKNIYFKK